MTKTTTATAIALAMQTSGISAEAVLAALEGLKRQPAESPPKPPKKISNQDQIAKLKPGVYPVRNAVGLYLRKGEGESGAWFRRYWSNGKRREMGFGPISGTHKVTLEAARDKATVFDNERRQGNDPLELKRAAARARMQAAMPAEDQDRWNFKTATEMFLRAHESSWKHPRASKTWFNPIERYAYPVIGNMALNDIGISHIEKIMDAAAAGTIGRDGKPRPAPKVAPRIRLRIEQIINAATVRGKRSATLPNPASVKLINAIRPKTKHKGEHFRRIEVADAPMAFRRLRELATLDDGSTALSALCFTILTAARPSEALNASWGEIDLEKKLWTVPAARMKGGERHVVPLSSLAIAVLERQARVRTGDAVFPGRDKAPVSYASFSRAAASTGFDVGSPHSWRSVFKDWATDIAEIARDTSEAALAHKLPPVEGAYRRERAVPARATAMESYAAWLLDKAGTGKVVKLEKMRA
jgi:integrase